MEPKLKDFVGQQNIIAQIKDEIDASKPPRNTALPNFIFTGHPGLGKSLLVGCLAAERGVCVWTLTGTQLNETMLSHTIASLGSDPPEYREAMLKAGKKCRDGTEGYNPHTGDVIDRSAIRPDILLIEEADGGGNNRDIFEILHSILQPDENGRRRFLAKKPGTSTRKLAWCPECTIIMTTNFLGRLRKKAPAAVNRCTVLQFEPYSEDELILLLKGYAGKLGIGIDQKAVEIIASRSMGIPRTAKRLFDRVYTRLIAAKQRGERRSSNRINEDLVNGAFSTLKIDDLGLEPTARQYLLALAENPSGKMGAASLAATIGVDQETLTVDIEPFLLRAGLVNVQSGGRQISAKGLEHIGLANADPLHRRFL